MVKNLQDQDSIFLESIGKRFKELRVNAGYSSYESFAMDHNLDRKQYWRIENGSNITLLTMNKLIQIHQITPEEFFKGVV